MIEKGETIIQQTRTFDTVKGITLPLRDKEDAHDYRYFPEPDLLPIVISDEQLATLQAEMPALPDALYQEFTETFGLSDYDANILVDEKAMADYFLALANHTKNYKSAANWLINAIRSHLNENNQSISDFAISPKSIADLIQLIDDEKVGNFAAKKNIFPAMLQSPNRSPLEIAQSLNLIQEGDSDFITSIVKEVLAKYPEQVAEYKGLPNNKKGKKRQKGLTSLFIGEVMKASRGKANPKIATATLIKALRN